MRTLLKEGYKRIEKNGITHHYDVTENAHKSIMSRVEYFYPQVNHEMAHLSFRAKELSPTLKSVLFLLKNYLVPIQERLYRSHMW